MLGQGMMLAQGKIRWLLLALVVSPGLIQAQSITEYPGGASPQGITAGPDGALWFTQAGGEGETLSRITTAGSITANYSAPSVELPAITTGPDGNLWLGGGTSENGADIYQFTTAGVSTSYQLPSNTSVSGITTGSDGNLWFTESDVSQIGKITTSGTVTEFEGLTGTPRSIVSGPDGALWFTEAVNNGLGKIGRIATNSVPSAPNITEYAITGIDPTQSPQGITVGPDGALWFTVGCGNGTSATCTVPDFIGRITTAGVVTTFALAGSVPPSGSYGWEPEGIAAGPDGALWFTEENASAIGRITTGGVVTQYTTPTGQSSPTQIVQGPDKALWFVESAASQIGRLAVPGAIAASGGTPQSAAITTAFGTALQATVTDAGGNPLGGQTVTFAVPATGASAALSSLTAVTNSSGVASVTATANNVAGSYNVTAAVADLTAPATFALTNTPGAPAAVTELGGTKQSTPIQTPFALPLQLLVTDAGNNPVPGVTVAFAAPASGASAVLSNAAPVTNAMGIVSVTATANSIVGNYSLTATVAGIAPASYLLTNTVGAPAAVTATGGTPQSTPIDSGFGAALQATVTDAGGNSVSGVTVTFAVPASGASAVLSSNKAVTNSAGVASVKAGSNANVGSYTVTATVANVGTPASFSLTNTVGAPATVTATGGTPQSAAIGAAFAAALRVTVTDAGGNPVSGVTVSFAAPGSGASATLSSSAGLTNASGAASVTAIANLTVGRYAVTASVAGVAAPASFSLTNTAGPPAGLTVVSGTPQSAVINSAFAAPLQAKVTDVGGNPVSGATVTFTVPGSGASAALSAGTAMTNAAGVASVTAKANSKVGFYNVNATVGGVATPATFVLTNTVGAPAAIAITSGTPQSAGINTPFGGALQVTVSDAGNNPVSGITVFFAAPATGASATLSAPSAVTNAAGIASVTAKANSIAGSYNVAAAISTLPVLNFALTNTAGVPASLTITGGTPQSATINAAFSAPLQVTVTDAGNNPLSGVIVVFTAPASGASAVLSGATATTNSAGVASLTATANATAGSYMVTATVSDVQNPVSFALTNNTGSPALLTAVGGTPQTALLNTAFGAPLQVKVTDAGSNPLSGVTVAFLAPKTGATAALSSSTAVTSASGIASVTATANATVGTYSVTAAIYQVTSTASFVLTNSVTAPLSITTAALPSGITSIHYETTLAAVNGTAPLSWSLPEGTLPGGLSLSTSGVISGTPSAAGSFPLTVKVTDATGQTAQAALTIVISAAPTISNLPATQQPNTAISGVQITVPASTATPITGTITLTFAASVAGLPAGYADPAMAFAGGGTTYNFTIAAGTASVTVPDINPGTVAGTIVASIVESGITVATADVVVPDVAPVIKPSSVQITNVTASGFDVEVVASSSTPCNISTATFTFNAATGAQITGTTFTVDVSSQIGTWYGTVANLQSYGSAFTLTVPFTLSGSIAAIQSVDVTLTNSAGTSTAVSGTQ